MQASNNIRSYAIVQRCVICVALCSGFFVNSKVYAITQNENGEFYKEIESAANAEIKNSQTPSLQISVGLGLDVIYEGAFGISNIEDNVKATPETKYRTASVAKWFTAVAAMRLAEKGKLDLEKPIQHYCPEFPKKEWPITAIQLLTHTAGIRHYIDYEDAIVSATSRDEKFRLEVKRMQETISNYTRFTNVIAPLETFKDDPLLFEPGSNWEYTSFGYRLLACVMQGAAGKDYHEIMRDLIFGVVGMNNTVQDDAWTIVPNRASGYRLTRGKSIRRADMRDVSENLPAGGYLSTSTDLVKFALAFNNGLVSERHRGLMSSPVVVGEVDGNTPRSWRDAIPSKEKYGFGLMLFSNYKKEMVGHTGRQAGGSAIIVSLPRERIAIAIMTNAKGWNSFLTFAMKIDSIVEKHFPESKLSAK